MLTTKNTHLRMYRAEQREKYVGGLLTEGTGTHVPTRGGTKQTKHHFLCYVTDRKAHKQYDRAHPPPVACHAIARLLCLLRRALSRSKV